MLGTGVGRASANASCVAFGGLNALGSIQHENDEDQDPHEHQHAAPDGKDEGSDGPPLPFEVGRARVLRIDGDDHLGARGMPVDPGLQLLRVAAEALAVPVGPADL